MHDRLAVKVERRVHQAAAVCFFFEFPQQTVIIGICTFPYHLGADRVVAWMGAGGKMVAALGTGLKCVGHKLRVNVFRVVKVTPGAFGAN